MLGMTEAGGTFLLSADETDQPETRRGSFGTPAPGFDTKIIDGELCIRGPYVMQRYYGRTREECFDADGWFHTGDLVRADHDGFLYYLGRRGAMIKTAGANVSPVEVAQAIARVTGGVVAHVLGLPDPERGQVVAAVLALADNQPFDEPALREALRRELSTYKVPRKIVAVPAARIPLLSSGKVDARRLPELFDA
jgi:acyl-CoA synthetase (AMP-forming)/AMP-acid ligase II